MQKLIPDRPRSRFYPHSQRIVLLISLSNSSSNSSRNFI